MSDFLPDSLAFGVMTVWPYARILKRAGLNPWFAVLVFLPLVGHLAVLAMLGHARWPTLPPAPPPRVPKPRVA